MIQAAQVAVVLQDPASTIVDVHEPGRITPANEAQARELAPLLGDPARLRETWQQAVHSAGGSPTAAQVRAARNGSASVTAPPVPPTGPGRQGRAGEASTKRGRAGRGRRGRRGGERPGGSGARGARGLR